VHLIYNVYFVLAGLWCISHLLYQVPDVVYRVVGSSIQFMYIERSMFIEAGTGVAGIAGLALRGQVLAVNGFGQDTGTSSFAYTSGTAEQKGLRQMILADSIF
jgi:hypothetical protein